MAENQLSSPEHYYCNNIHLLPLQCIITLGGLFPGRTEGGSLQIHPAFETAVYRQEARSQLNKSGCATGQLTTATPVTIISNGSTVR